MTIPNKYPVGKHIILRICNHFKNTLRFQYYKYNSKYQIYQKFTRWTLAHSTSLVLNIVTSITILSCENKPCSEDLDS